MTAIKSDYWVPLTVMLTKNELPEKSKAQEDRSGVLSLWGMDMQKQRKRKGGALFPTFLLFYCYCWSNRVFFKAGFWEGNFLKICQHCLQKQDGYADHEQ